LRSDLFGAQKDQLQHGFAGQAVGINEVHDDIWLVSFMDYDLGYFDLDTRVLEPLDNPFGRGCYLCSRYILLPMSPDWTGH
jgi:putative transposase